MALVAAVVAVRAGNHVLPRPLKGTLRPSGRTVWVPASAGKAGGRGDSPETTRKQRRADVHCRRAVRCSSARRGSARRLGRRRPAGRARRSEQPRHRQRRRIAVPGLQLPGEWWGSDRVRGRWHQPAVPGSQPDLHNQAGAAVASRRNSGLRDHLRQLHQHHPRRQPANDLCDHERRYRPGDDDVLADVALVVAGQNTNPPSHTYRTHVVSVIRVIGGQAQPISGTQPLPNTTWTPVDKNADVLIAEKSLSIVAHVTIPGLNITATFSCTSSAAPFVAIGATGAIAGEGTGSSGTGVTSRVAAAAAPTSSNQLPRTGTSPWPLVILATFCVGS